MYLPNAAWTRAYHLAGVTLEQLRDPNRYRYDVSFFGRLDAAKYPEMRERAAFFSELEQRLSRQGVSTCLRHSAGMSLSEPIDFIQRSRINLNYGAGCDDGPERSWGLPERCYGVPACGGFLLSDDRRHAENDFVVGKEWIHFSDLDDAVAKIRYYLDNFGEARWIAEAAHARVMKDHLYVNRARSLIDAATAWRKRVKEGPQSAPRGWESIPEMWRRDAS
jgi:spore maturation protein CgeB